MSSICTRLHNSTLGIKFHVSILVLSLLLLSVIIYIFSTFGQDKVTKKSFDKENFYNMIELENEIKWRKKDFEKLISLSDSIDTVNQKLTENKQMFDLIAGSLNYIAKYVEAHEKNENPKEYLKKEESKNGFLIKSVLSTCPYKYNGPIYILMTTTPERINSLEKYLELLHRQTYDIHEIIISIPYKFERTGKEYPPLPDFLLDRKKFPLVRILRGKDYGPATKFLLPLEIGNISKDSGLIVLDDDTKYSRHLVCDYLYMHENFPDAALGRRGQAFHDKCDPTYRIDRTYRLSHDQKSANFIVKSADLLSGVGTYFLQMKFLDDDIFSLKDKCPSETIEHLFFTDDIFISGYLAYKNISRIVFSDNLSGSILHKPYIIGSGPGALWDINKNSFHNDNSTAALGLYWGCQNIDTIYLRYNDILCKWNS
ncbi:hypothetical protein ACR3K2_34720 [Cryptosporidium serpentis]